MTTDAPERMTITLPPLHKNQQAIAKHPARFKVVCCGRRWGKTLLAMTLCMRDAIKGKRIWHVAPTYKQTLEGWSYLQRLVQQLPVGVAKTHISELTVQFTGGGSIQLRTADNPDNLRGSGLDGVVIDEAATVKQEAWDLVLRPALADRQGWALFISTPQHFNWFWDLYQRGEDPETEDWASWQMPTWDNPYIAESEIEAAQRDMEPADFDQEFGASFTAVGGAVFPLLSANRPTYLRPMPQGTELRRKGVGMDWGTTKEHNAAVVGGGIMATGAVWITSSWLSDNASSFDWNDEAVRVKRTIGATFARVDRSQSSNLDPIKALGFDADSGLANVEARIGMVQALVRRQAIYFDSRDEGVRLLYQHMCEYHRHPEGTPKAGQPVEEHDDDVDALHYLVAELVQPKQQYVTPQSTRPVSRRIEHAIPRL
jgi:hypothetical protein